MLYTGTDNCNETTFIFMLF